MEVGGEVHFWWEHGGCITSTPKLLRFLKKSQKTPKYERDSCMPGPKNGERPYLAVPETPFLGSVFWLFLAYFRAPAPHIYRACIIYIQFKLSRYQTNLPNTLLCPSPLHIHISLPT